MHEARGTPRRCVRRTPQPRRPTVTPELREALRVVAEANPPGSAIPVPRETLLELLAMPRHRVQAPALADLTVKEAGLILQRKPVTVRLWCERGQVPGAYKYG